MNRWRVLQRGPVGVNVYRVGRATHEATAKSTREKYLYKRMIIRKIHNKRALHERGPA